jgi:hypothetical protein
MLTVSTQQPTTAAMAVTGFGNKLTVASGAAFTTGTSWMSLGGDGTSLTNFHLADDYRLAPPQGQVLSETETSATSGDWVGVIATFR